MDVLSAVILVVFAVIGVISVVRDLTCFLFRYKNDNSVMFVTPINGKRDDDLKQYLLMHLALNINKFII